jgi:hypothetical protein
MTEETTDIFDIILSQPIGAYKYFHSEGKENDILQSMENKEELLRRITHARNSGCFIEVISLRLQHMELWLRFYYNNVPHKEPRHQEFGRLIRQCFEAGLDKHIYDRISAFNRDRRISIHGFLMGSNKYDDFYKTVIDSDGLSEELIKFVVLNSGEIVTPEHRNSHSNVGDLIVSVSSVLETAKVAQ